MTTPKYSESREYRYDLAALELVQRQTRNAADLNDGGYESVDSARLTTEAQVSNTMAEFTESAADLHDPIADGHVCRHTEFQDK